MTHAFHPPCPYQIKSLSLAHMPALLSLQYIVIAALPEDDKDFITFKTEEKFAERMSQFGEMHGVFLSTNKGDQLVAYGGVVFPTAIWPTADLSLEPHHKIPFSPQELAVIQSCAVHPEHRGKSLHKWLIAAKEELCLKKGRPHMMSEVAVANPASLKGFLNQGYKVIFSGIAPEDQCKLLFLHKNAAVSPPPLRGEEKPISIDPVHDFDLLQTFLGSGCHGISMTRGNGPKNYTLNLSAPLYKGLD